MRLSNFLTARKLYVLSALTLTILLFVSASNVFDSSAQKVENTSDVVLAGTLSGRVFQDFNGNGLYETTGGTAAAPSAVDIGVAGVVVTAYNPAGVASGTATTVAAGTYSFTTAGTGPYRVEFTSLPAGYTPSARSRSSATTGTATNAGSTVQFVADGTVGDVNLALVRANDYCVDNPNLCSQLYAPLAANLPEALFTVNYTAGSTRTGTETTTVADFQVGTKTSIATADQVGSTFGLAFNRITRTTYAAAYMKRHTKFGPNGPGAIYQVNNAGTVSLYANLNTLFAGNPAGADPHDVNDYNVDGGVATVDPVGKLSFGGMAISDDQNFLFAMNLANRSLYRIPTTTTPTAGNVTSYAFPTTGVPNCANAGDVRPFAVTFYEGTVYVGAVCSGDVSDSAANVRAYVYEFNPNTLAFNTTPRMNFQMNYPRLTADPGVDAEWLAWRTAFSDLTANTNFIYPQPMFSDIDFDRGNLIMSFRDRLGDQTGLDNPSNPATPGTNGKGITAGEILRACGNPTAGWTLEVAGRCAGVGSAPQQTLLGSGEGPGNGVLFGEYYYQDNYHPDSVPHSEVSVGAAAQIPGHNVMVASVFDPVYLGGSLNTFDAQGLRWFVNGTGGQNRGYLANAGDFGKANGQGNLIAMCVAAPIEIGNRVWRDTNANGVQDPGENGIAGVTVRLYQGNVLVGTAITDANGEYYFVTSAVADPNQGDNIGQVSLNGGILYTTAYQVRFDAAANYAAGGPLAGLLLTAVNRTTQAGDDDSSDSDATTVTNPVGSPTTGSFPVIALTTGSPGSNNHTFDVGFALPPSAANVTVTGRITTANGNGIRNVRVYLTEEDGTVHQGLTGSFGFYIFEEIPGGQNVVISVAAKRYTFPQTARLVTLGEDVTELDWVSNE